MKILKRFLNTNKVGGFTDSTWQFSSIIIINNSLIKFCFNCLTFKKRFDQHGFGLDIELFKNKNIKINLGLEKFWNFWKLK